jgi:integrase
LASGRIEASIPKVKGSRDRVFASFDSTAQAQAWLKQAAANVAADQDVVTPTETVAQANWLVELCCQWHERHHRIEQHASPERAAAVWIHIAKHIVPYFAQRWETPNKVGYDTCTNFVQFLAGRRDSSDRLAVGIPTIKTRSISPSYQGEIIRTLSAVLDEGMKKGIVATNPAKGLRTVKQLGASTRQKTTKSAGVYTLCQYSGFAAQLHLIHQLALWLQRIVGLRVSEAYGIRVGDVRREGSYGIYYVAAQGGRSFSWWDENGVAVEGNRVDRTKTAESLRVVIFPPALMELIDLVIDAFHVGVNGEIDYSAPLVPGILKIDGGSEAYRGALREIGLGDEEHLATHDARHSLITDLANKTSISDVRRRLMAGHSNGKDVHDRVYVHQSPDLAPAKAACDEIQALILTEIATLIQPTVKRPKFARTHPMYAVRSRSDEVLTTAGVYVCDGSVLTTEEVAVLIGRNERVTRNLCKDGVIAAVKRRGADHIDRWVVTRGAVDEFISRYRDLRTLEEGAAELELSYHQAYELGKRLKVLGEPDSTTGLLVLTIPAIDAMRAEQQRIARLRQRSMTINEAELALGRRRSTLAGWIGKRLELDPEVDGAGCKYVTRASVARSQDELAALPKRKRNLPGRP